MTRRVLLAQTYRPLLMLENRANFASALPKQMQKGPQVIACKRRELDFYLGTRYDKLDEVPLASRGWNHSRAKYDYFTILPTPEEVSEKVYPFEEVGINNHIINSLKVYGINYATDFQARAIETIQKGLHTLLAAETGCGKTISYLLPVIKKLLDSKGETQMNTPRAVVLVPNRELAYQVGEMAATLCNSVGLVASSLVGGKTKQMMLNPTFRDVDLLVATPGALSKLSTVGIYKLFEVSTLVLDEADTLTDDSFVDRIEILLKRMAKAQIILVTATLPRTLPDVLQPYGEAMQHVVSPRLHKPLLNITQKFMRLTRSVKPANLLQIAKTNKDPMLIFTNRNETCKWLAMFLRENNLSCSNISGDMNYYIRIEQWNQFVKGETNILAATDIGSRGLNTIQVKQVLNYDFPLYAADYIHRTGRVGRIGSPKDCLVTNFVCSPEEIKLVQQIELAVRKSQPLNNVDGNITNIVHKKLLRKVRDSS